MQNGYYQATGGMVTQFNKLNVISNNLANVNTIGFKRDDVVIGDFKRIFQDVRDELPLRDHTKEAAKFINRSIDRVPQVSEEYINFSQGGVKSTGNTLDFALKRPDIFLLVQTPNGIRLTQNGSLNLNENGELITKEGYAVLPADYFNSNETIRLPQDARITVDKSGAIYANDELISNFYIALPEDLRRLTKEGDNLYIVNPEQIENLENADAIAQGYLQTSNINPVKEMVSLIEANRMVEMYQKVMTTHMNDLNSEAVNKLASTKG